MHGVTCPSGLPKHSYTQEQPAGAIWCSMTCLRRYQHSAELDEIKMPILLFEGRTRSTFEPQASHSPFQLRIQSFLPIPIECEGFKSYYNPNCFYIPFKHCVLLRNTYITEAKDALTSVSLRH